MIWYDNKLILYGGYPANDRNIYIIDLNLYFKIWKIMHIKDYTLIKGIYVISKSDSRKKVTPGSQFFIKK